MAAVVAITALGALLRFPTLDVQSFSGDEAFTVILVRENLGGLVEGVARSESTPPLYYLLAWAWSHLFGSGEVGLRSLSALVGTATIPVAYATAARLICSRAGLTTAALVSVNPMLVWYSQDARSYALLVLLGAVSFLFFVASRDAPRPAHLAAWAAASALALATHYFAAFLVIPEALWLVFAMRARRSALLAAGVVVATGAALTPLALSQRGNGAFLTGLSFFDRLAAVPKKFALGESAAQIDLAPVVGAAVVLAAAAAALLLLRTDGRQRQGAVRATSVAAIVILAPLLLAAVGVDYFNARNLIVALVPALVALSAGLTSSRARPAGVVITAGLVALGLGVTAAVNLDSALQREDWRGLAERLRSQDRPRAVVLTPLYGFVPLFVYEPRLSGLPPAGASVTEVAVMDVDPSSPAPPREMRLPHFAITERTRSATWTLVRLTAPRPVTLRPRDIEGLALKGVPPSILAEPPAR